MSDWPVNARECSKKSVQQGRSRFDERSVLSVREYGKTGRTPLAAFSNIPLRVFSLASLRKAVLNSEPIPQKTSYFMLR